MLKFLDQKAKRDSLSAVSYFMDTNNITLYREMCSISNGNR